jgi:hypothetical protein
MNETIPNSFVLFAMGSCQRGGPLWRSSRERMRLGVQIVGRNTLINQIVGAPARSP